MLLPSFWPTFVTILGSGHLHTLPLRLKYRSHTTSTTIFKDKVWPFIWIEKLERLSESYHKGLKSSCKFSECQCSIWLHWLWRPHLYSLFIWPCSHGRSVFYSFVLSLYTWLSLTFWLMSESHCSQLRPNQTKNTTKLPQTPCLTLKRSNISMLRTMRSIGSTPPYSFTNKGQSLWRKVWLWWILVRAFVSLLVLEQVWVLLITTSGKVSSRLETLSCLMLTTCRFTCL